MTLTFRPLKKADFPMFAAWLGKPHVNRWWHEPATVEFVSHEYGACTNGDFTTSVYVVMDCEKPIGIIQSFKLESYPETAQLLDMPGAVSIDYFIGEVDYIGRGFGARMIEEFVNTIIRKKYLGASGVATSAEVGNLASLGALAKVGFRAGEVVKGEHGPERVMRLRFN